MHWWLCNICSRYTAKGKNKCRGCGAKKAWATWESLAKSGPESHIQGQTWPTTSMPLTAYLPSSDHWPSLDVFSSPSAATGAETANAGKDKGESPQQVIKSLEVQLATLPAGATFDPTRAFIKAQIEETKKKITKSKSLPSQLASCSAALERAKARAEKTQEAAQKKEDQYIWECGQVQELEGEVRWIEAELATASASTTPASSIDEMSNALQRVLAEMRKSEAVPEHVVSAAQQAMEGLFASVTAVASEAAAVSSQQAAAEKGKSKGASNGAAKGLGRTIGRAASDPSVPPIGRSQPYPSENLGEVPTRRTYGKTLVATPCIAEKAAPTPCLPMIEQELVPQVDPRLLADMMPTSVLPS